MSTTTVTAPGATTVPRRARIAVTGAVLWLLLPLAWAAADLETLSSGTVSFLAVAASYWLCLVLPPALLAVGYAALWTSLGARAGRLGRTGIPVAVAGLLAMTVGNGIEVASLSAGGGEVALGHTIFFVGFLVSIGGGMLTGIAVLRRRPDGPSRMAGWLLVLALPLGIGISLLGSLMAPESDAAFWAGIAVPTGLAWLLLGRTLAARAS